MISLYHICPSKLRAYSIKGELKKCFKLLVVLFNAISMRPDMYIILGWGGGYKGEGKFSTKNIL